MPIQNNFPSIGFELLPNIWRANISWECLVVIQNPWRENYFEWAFMNGPKSDRNVSFLGEGLDLNFPLGGGTIFQPRGGPRGGPKVWDF